MDRSVDKFLLLGVNRRLESCLPKPKAINRLGAWWNSSVWNLIIADEMIPLFTNDDFHIISIPNALFSFLTGLINRSEGNYYTCKNLILHIGYANIRTEKMQREFIFSVTSNYFAILFMKPLNAREDYQLWKCCVS